MRPAAWALAALCAATAIAPAAAGWTGGGDLCQLQGVAQVNGSYGEALFQATVGESTTSTWLVWYNRTARRSPGRATAVAPQRQPNATVIVWVHDASERSEVAELARAVGCSFPAASGADDAADSTLRAVDYHKLIMSACQVEQFMNASSLRSTELAAVTCAETVAHSPIVDGARLVFGLSVCDADATGPVRYWVRVRDAYSVSACPQDSGPLALVIGSSLLAAGALLLAGVCACFLARQRRQRRDAAAGAPEERTELRAAAT